MIEKEVKIKVCCSEMERIMNVMRKIGAKVLGNYREVDIYFAHPCRDFSKTDETLRIRTFNGKDLCELTYKGPRTCSERGVKAREEITARILRSDVKGLALILRRLGFKEVTRVSKERVEFQIGEVKVALDRVEKLGCFIEIEFPKEELLRRILDMLNIEEKFVEKTYLEMLLNHNLESIKNN